MKLGDGNISKHFINKLKKQFGIKFWHVRTLKNLAYATIYISSVPIVFLIFLIIKTHNSELRGQGGSTLQRPLDKCT